MENKNNMVIVVIAIIIIVATAIFFFKKDVVTKPAESPTATQAEVDFKQAISADTTVDINKSLDAIDLTDTTATDIQGVDQELKTL